METCRNFIDGSRVVVGEITLRTLPCLFLWAADGGRGGRPVTILGFTGEGRLQRGTEFCAKPLVGCPHLSSPLEEKSSVFCRSLVCWKDILIVVVKLPAAEGKLIFRSIQIPRKLPSSTFCIYFENIVLLASRRGKMRLNVLPFSVCFEKKPSPSVWHASQGGCRSHGSLIDLHDKASSLLAFQKPY